MPSKHIENIVNYITGYIIGGKYNIFHIRRGDAVSGKFKHNYCISSIYLFARYINMSDEINVLLSDDYDYCTKFLDVLCPDKFIIINKTNLNKNKNMYEPKYGINNKLANVLYLYNPLICDINIRHNPINVNSARGQF
jgi:hypothetical protein